VTDFTYDPAGNRVKKTTTTVDGSSKTTYHIRDASGNIMATYEVPSSAIEPTLKEMPIYGSSRLGEYRGQSVWGQLQLGERRYEVSNHLGNVLSTFTDQLIVDTNGDRQLAVTSASDYYPFGVQMPGRNLGSGSYRYGFNGKEKDDDGEFGSTVYDYGFRIYNPQIAKFLSVDPLTRSYPMLTPYQYASNNPIAFIDLDGLEGTMPLPWWQLLRPTITLPRVPTIPIPTPPSYPLPPAVYEPTVDPIPIFPNTPSKPLNFESAIDWDSPPSSPDELDSSWEETTHPNNKSGSRDFRNKDTGENVRWDPGKEGKPGWEGKDHWHRHNPDKSGKGDYYLDRFGNPVPKGSGPSHIGAGESFLIAIPSLIDDANKRLEGLRKERSSLSIWRRKDWGQIKSIWDQMGEIEDYIDQLRNYKQEWDEYQENLKDYNDSCENCKA
ncbi:MAG: RHS repeat-associated core domain-containing protein, partial [Bacteroidota bacterium]